MALTYLTLDVMNVQLTTSESIEFLIDTGASFSVVPASTLERLGIERLDTTTFKIVGGRSVSRQYGGAVFRYQGHAGVSNVIFGEEGDVTVLGALTLESLGLAVDPLRRELIQLPMLL